MNVKKMFCAASHEKDWKIVGQVPSEVNTTGFHICFVKCQKCGCEWGPRQAVKSRYWSGIIERQRQAEIDKEPLVQ